MKTILRITMPDESQWDVPADLVAHDRAAYYTGQTSGKEHTALYKKELKYTLSDHDELIDWANNNMNWDDVKASAKLHKAGSVDYQDGWVNGDKEVVEEK